MSPGGGRQNKPEEEMFLNSSSSGRASPVIEPLRIHKKETPSPVAATGQQNAAASSHSSSTFPHPDNRARPQQMRAGSSSSPQPAYPDGGRTASPANGGKASPPHQSNASAPPAGSGAARPSDYPASLRPRNGREPKPATLAERRGNVPKPLPDSSGPEAPDEESLFQRAPYRAQTAPIRSAPPHVTQYSDYHRQYWPPPESSTVNHSSSAAQERLRASNPSSINRINSTASTSTTRAQRGSPPPPETPVVGPGQQPGSDIEARYAASGIAGTSTLAGLQAQSAAAQRRAEQYVGQQPRTQQPVQRPWTPTEPPGSHPYGPPTVYQGPNQITSPNPVSPPIQSPKPGSAGQSAQAGRPSRIPPNALEQDLERMQINSSPPPAYSSVPGANTTQEYPNEKHRPAGATQQHPATSNVASPAPTAQTHPAFANDPRQQQPVASSSSSSSSPQPNLQNGHSVNGQRPQVSASPAPSSIPPASPPPLPEGWIAHLDPNSGQYYYIHLPTQSTQWEFPKGPTPLNLNDAPLSPVGSAYSHPLSSPGLSTFGGKPLASPGLPLTPGYDCLNSPAGGFTGPPPTSGVDLYKVAPMNGVYFGPYLRYTNMDLERGIWLGSILLVTDAPQPPTIHIHQSIDLSPNPRQLKAVKIAVHQRWTFYKYEIDLKMEESGPAKWTYAVTSHLGCTRYEFLVAGRYETNWRFVATSGNDFSINVNANERARLGGVGFMWKDIMQKHAEIGGFHAQLCLGGQIYADRIWKEIPLLKQWLAMSGKETRKNAPWTAAHEEDVSHAYFHYYTSHFDQPYLREAFAQIPYISQIDDHDM